MPAERPLKIGLHLPEVERIAPWTDLAAMCRMAEEIGMDSIWVPDHLLYRSDEETPPGGGRWPVGPEGVEPTGPWECWSIISAVAAVTSRVEIGPLVLCTSFRNPALIAKMASTVDEISGGRLILGLGAGWNEAEYRAYGYPYDHRVSRFEEAFTIIRTLLREGYVDFAGEYYQARECELRPRGPRPEGPPLMIGSRGERMLRATLPYVDAWNSWGLWYGNRPGGLAALRNQVNAICREVGRDPAEIEHTTTVFVQMPGGIEDDGPPLSGTPEELAAAMRAFADQGVSNIQVLLDPNTVESVEAFAPVIERLK
jgi:alkanesulfonate monooxygenase SsuD/methylene tetrahydromethanopterin reductase-like flavin-dependent oxidoreductase (luciferase family)